MNVRVKQAMIAGVALLGACGGDGPASTSVVPPATSTGIAVLAVSNAPNGLAAIRFRVAGSGITNPTGMGSARILFRHTVADTTTFLIAVPAGNGPVLQLQLADRSRTPAVVVQEASAGRVDGYRSLAPSSVIITAQIQP